MHRPWRWILPRLPQDVARGIKLDAADDSAGRAAASATLASPPSPTRVAAAAPDADQSTLRSSGSGGDELPAALFSGYAPVYKTLVEPVRGDKVPGPSKVLSWLEELPDAYDEPALPLTAHDPYDPEAVSEDGERELARLLAA